MTHPVNEESGHQLFDRLFADLRDRPHHALRELPPCHDRLGHEEDGQLRHAQHVID
ncbi:hypothetical protein ACP_2847 [Acidobacterium capsulatum ATCC 51196]|uniref:Uncharacterized protein n=1 Tax=Acidobacterium capsulatum (strain ATCC 51196 / DSM 11244 / BCRC 80197 / JCM 7670 / NBRC 15755 / NCIMB 13165 / 161) TaxID=240015 RepID=C1F3Q9_ACIC5|nr:hypothetical protein ACP_2847 [Acidobacterium capsulatum ATCC 51196]